MRLGRSSARLLAALVQVSCSDSAGSDGEPPTTGQGSSTENSGGSGSVASASTESGSESSGADTTSGGDGVCGNGVVEPGEQCDGSPTLGVPCPDSCRFRSGEELWFVRVGEPDTPEKAYGVAVGSGDSLFVAGSRQDQLGVVEAMVSRVEADGTVAWSRFYTDDPQLPHEFLDVDTSEGLVATVGEFGALCGVVAWTEEGDVSWLATHGRGGADARFKATSVVFLGADRILVACQQTDPVSVNPLFLLEYDRSGNMVAETQIDDPVPSPSNVVIAPRLARSTDAQRFAFGASALAPTPFDAWLSVYSASGDPLWDHVADGPADLDVDAYLQVSFLADDGVVAVGTFNTDTSSDAWVHAFDATGAMAWSVTVGAPSYEEDGQGVAVGSDGSVFVHGDARVDDAGDFDHWLHKYDSDGGEIWRQTWSDPDSTFSWDYASELAIDANGFVVAIGTAYTPEADQDVIVRKIAP